MEENLQSIERTNQRGGRTLSIVDLIDAGTISTDAAAFCGAALSAGCSFFTGAAPGGAGKTTLMAALLGMLPRDERIITASGIDAIEAAAAAASGGRPVCLLAHEVGDGQWYGYIWGPHAAAFLKAGEAGARLVTTLHADNPEQVREIFGRCGIDRAIEIPVALQLFIQRHGNGSQRRISAIYFDTGGRMQPVFRWDEKDGALKAAMTEEELVEKASSSLAAEPDDFRDDWKSHRELLTGLRESGTNDFEAVARIFSTSRVRKSI